MNVPPCSKKASRMSKVVEASRSVPNGTVPNARMEGDTSVAGICRYLMAARPFLIDCRCYITIPCGSNAGTRYDLLAGKSAKYEKAGDGRKTTFPVCRFVVRVRTDRAWISTLRKSIVVPLT